MAFFPVLRCSDTIQFSFQSFQLGNCSFSQAWTQSDFEESILIWYSEDWQECIIAEEVAM